MLEVQNCQTCQIFSKKMFAHPNLLHPIVVVNPFTKWGIYFMTYHLASDTGHNYVIVVVNCFTKRAKVMHTYSNNANISMFFIFNHIITRFGMPKIIITDHGSHLQQHDV